jgi:hypothetical protein
MKGDKTGIGIPLLSRSLTMSGDRPRANGAVEIGSPLTWFLLNARSGTGLHLIDKIAALAQSSTDLNAVCAAPRRISRTLIWARAVLLRHGGIGWRGCARNGRPVQRRGFGSLTSISHRSLAPRLLH